MAGLALPEPDRVNQRTIELCHQQNNENFVKKRLRFMYSHFLKALYNMPQMGEGFKWGSHWKFRRQSMISVGRYVFIGPYAWIIYPTVIGDLTLIAPHVQIIGNDHGFTEVGMPTRITSPKVDSKKIVTIIQSEVWIGQRSTIMHGVRIGRGAVVAAGSVVTKDVEPYTVVGGNPAHFIRNRFDNSGDLQKHINELYG